MDIPLQLLIYISIILIYTFYKKKKGQSLKLTSKRLGLSLSYGKYYLWGVLIAAFSILFSWLILSFFPFEISLLNDSAYSNYDIKEISLISILFVLLKELVYVTFGEELIFRGLIGGYLFKKFNFIVANTLQTIIFLLPHLLLLFISLKLYPFLLIIMFAGWFLGWLRYKSNSIFPGVLAHTIVNTFSIIYFFAIT
jgi:membrane protease YdiL (CAAX protease family)